MGKVSCQYLSLLRCVCVFALFFLFVSALLLCLFVSPPFCLFLFPLSIAFFFSPCLCFYLYLLFSVVSLLPFLCHSTVVFSSPFGLSLSTLSCGLSSENVFSCFIRSPLKTVIKPSIICFCFFLLILSLGAIECLSRNIIRQRWGVCRRCQNAARYETPSSLSEAYFSCLSQYDALAGFFLSPFLFLSSF